MPVNFRHPEYQKNLRRWRISRAVCDGEDAVKEMGAIPGAATTGQEYGVSPGSSTGVQPLAQALGWPASGAGGYGVSWEILPPLSGHTDYSSYWSYVQHAHFFPAASRAREGMIGLLGKDEAVVEFPPGMEDFTLDVTGSNSAQDVDEFAAQIIFELMTVGRCGVLTDYPPRPKTDAGTPAPVPSKKDAEVQRIKPRWKLYKAEEVINWRIDRVRGKETVGLVVLEESSVVAPGPDAEDEFAWIPVLQWRVLDRAVPPPELADKLPAEAQSGDRKAYRVRFFVMADDGKIKQGPPIFPIVNGQLSEEVPFEFIGSLDCTAAVEKPPLYDVVTVNIGHYRSSAAAEHGALFCANPMAYVFGYDPDKETDATESEGVSASAAAPKLHWRMGSSEILVLKETNAKAGIISASAQDLGALEARIAVKREELSAIVGRILATEKKAAEAAQTEKVRRQGEQGVLSSIAANVSAALSRCLVRARDYMGLTGDASVIVPTQFWDTGLTALEATAIADLWMKYGVIAKSDVREQLRDSGFLNRSDEEVDAELEKEPVPPAPSLAVPGEGLAALGGKPVVGAPPVKPGAPQEPAPPAPKGKPPVPKSKTTSAA